MADLTAEQILALPEYSTQARVIHCSCGRTIRIPFMLEIKARYIEPSTTIAVVDQDGQSWTPVETEFGWVKRRL